MKRLRTILLFLLLGAVVNVGVAWGCALWWPVCKVRWIPVDQLGLLSYVCDFEDKSSSEIGFQKSLGLSAVRIQWASRPHRHTIWHIDVGWPVICLTGHMDLLDMKTTGCISAPPWMRPGNILGISRPLPITPLWQGLFSNSLFYAVFIWLLIPGPFALRRVIRNKRGLCVECAYDLKGADHEVCPECGAEIVKANPA